MFSYEYIINSSLYCVLQEDVRHIIPRTWGGERFLTLWIYLSNDKVILF